MFATVAPKKLARNLLLENLTPASGCQDHTTSPSARNVIRLLTCRVHRIPHSTSVTTAIRPSCEGGMGRDVEVIWVKRERECFYRRGWTDKWVICPSGTSPTSLDSSPIDLVSPAAVPPRVPTKTWSANHADRRSNNHRTGYHDDASVHIATTIRATMFAAAATFRSLGTNACEA